MMPNFKDKFQIAVLESKGIVFWYTDALKLFIILIWNLNHVFLTYWCLFLPNLNKINTLKGCLFYEIRFLRF